MSLPTSTAGCRVCANEIERLIDFGSQPIGNRFLATADAFEAQHQLVMGQCGRCGLVQLVAPASPEIVKPPVDTRYNEPAGHLEAVIESVCQLPGVTPETRFCGLTYKDQPLLNALRQRGYENGVCLDAARDLGVDDPAAGLETFQQTITGRGLQTAVGIHGRPQVLFVRHILEHAHAPVRFVERLREFVSPNGFLVFEVPDCARALERCDYSSPWEEHVSYFTPATFRHTLASMGLMIRSEASYPYTLENCLVFIGQCDAAEPSSSRKAGLDVATLAVERNRAQQFATGFSETKQHWQAALKKRRQDGDSIALLGAGHLAIMFINLMQVGELIDFVVDDNPDKCGRFLPGSHLPILPSAQLMERNVRLCLLAVAPESEARVLERNRSFMDAGGRFASIFPDSRFAFPIGMTTNSLERRR